MRMLDLRFAVRGMKAQLRWHTRIRNVSSLDALMKAVNPDTHHPLGTLSCARMDPSGIQANFAERKPFVSRERRKLKMNRPCVARLEA